MQPVILYLSTAAIFLILDAVMLTLVMKPLFTRHIGPLMLDDIRMGAAAAFYLAYLAGLCYLVSWPALTTGAAVVVPAAIIGAMAYGTYEFTSYAIMRDWHWSMVAADVTWGDGADGAVGLGGRDDHKGADMILYGISTCDTCKKAQRALAAMGHSVTFRDVRADPLTPAEITRFVQEFGDRIINRQSTTWRSLSDFLRESDAEVQLERQPTLMKRPVIDHDGRLTLGWDDAVAALYA